MYWFEQYDAQSWAIDGVPAYNAASANILLRANQSLDYRQYVVTVAASYRY